MKRNLTLSSSRVLRSGNCVISQDETELKILVIEQTLEFQAIQEPITRPEEDSFISRSAGRR